MCILAILYRVARNTPILVAANREEFFDRPTQHPKIQPGSPRVICGIDRQANGTWLGVNQHGLFATVTNRRKRTEPISPRSRGLLCRELLDMKTVFLSRMVYQTYNGYVMSQFKKMQTDIRNQGQVKWKHVMHLIRLLLSGVTVLREGFVPVRVGDHREALLQIKAGQMPWDEVEAWRLDLHKQFERAFEETALPERPDYEQANEYLVKARRLAMAEELP